MNDLFTSQARRPVLSLKKDLINSPNEANIGNLTYTVETITPEKAREYLRRNRNNRPLGRRKVRIYAQIMKEGKWLLNPADAIVFDRNGSLMNGQHRLEAVIESNQSVTFAIGRGADPQIFPVMDCGKKRSPSDVFAISGIKNAKLVSAIIGRYFVYKRQNSRYIMTAWQNQNIAATNISDIPRSDYLNEYYHDEEFWQDNARFSKRLNEKTQIMKARDIGGLYAYLVKTKRHESELVKEFLESLMLGGAKAKAIDKLRSMLLRENATRQRLENGYKYNLFAQTWNLYLQKKYRTPLNEKKLLETSEQIEFM